MKGALVPFAWQVSRIAEEFHIAPSQALIEPIGLAEEIMTMRSYARAKALIDAPSEAESESAFREEMKRHGLNDSLIDLVLANTERALGS